MKLFLVIALLTIQKNLNTQDTIPKINGEYGYKEMVLLDSTNKKEALFTKAKLFFASSLKGLGEMIQYEDKDKDAGKIVSKGMISVHDAYDNFVNTILYRWDIYFTTELSVKDGKYQFIIRHISIKQYSKSPKQPEYYSNLEIDEAVNATQKGSAKKLYTRLLKKMTAGLTQEIASLKSAMAMNITNTDNNF